MYLSENIISVDITRFELPIIVGHKEIGCSNSACIWVCTLFIWIHRYEFISIVILENTIFTKDTIELQLHFLLLC